MLMLMNKNQNLLNDFENMIILQVNTKIGKDGKRELKFFVNNSEKNLWNKKLTDGRFVGLLKYYVDEYINTRFLKKLEREVNNNIFQIPLLPSVNGKLRKQIKGWLTNRTLMMEEMEGGE